MFVEIPGKITVSTKHLGEEIQRTEMSAEEGRALVSDAVDSVFRAADAGVDTPVHAIKAEAGLGKTEAVLTKASSFLIDVRGRGDTASVVAVIAVPQHRLSDQLVERFNATAAKEGISLRAAVWRGYEATALDGKAPMCLNIEAVRKVFAVLGKPDEDVCPRCPHRDGCRYLAQRAAQADLWVVSHQLIFHKLPPPLKKPVEIAALIIDENFDKAGLVGLDEPFEIPFDRLTPGGMPTVKPGEDPQKGQRLQENRRRMALFAKRQPDGPVSADALRAHLGRRFDAKTIEIMIACEWSRKVDHGPVSARQDNRTLTAMVAFWRAVGRTLKLENGERSGWLTLGRNKDGVRVFIVRGRRELDEPWRVPTLLIDADLNPELTNHYFPETPIEVMLDVPVRAQHQRITQVVDRSHGLASLAPVKPRKGRTLTVAQRNRDRRATARCRELRDAILADARCHGCGPSDILVIGNKAVVEAMDLPKETPIGWFGAMRGMDQWGKLKRVYIIGRPQPSPQEVETFAACLTGRTPATLPKDKSKRESWYPRIETGRLIRCDGRVYRAPAKADQHPDRVVELCRSQICNAEVKQAVARLRGINRTADEPCEIVVLTDVVIDTPVDEILSFEQFAATSPIDSMLAEDGMAVMNRKLAAEHYPELFKTDRSLKDAMRRWADRRAQGISARPAPLTNNDVSGAGLRQQSSDVEIADGLGESMVVDAREGRIAGTFESGEERDRIEADGRQSGTFGEQRDADPYKNSLKQTRPDGGGMSPTGFRPPSPPRRSAPYWSRAAA